MEANFKVIALFCLWLQIVVAQIERFTNPILDIAQTDTALIKIDNFYYLAYSDNVGIQILKSPFLTNFRNAEKGTVFKKPAGYTSVFPTSFFQYRNDLYLHFHLRNSSAPYRMFCVQAKNPKHPLGTWSAPIRLLDHISKEESHHGHALNTNGQLYYVWSGPSNGKLSLQIAKMNCPTEVIPPVMLLREPQEDWECHGSCSIRASSYFLFGNKIYLTFTASTPLVPETSIGYISIDNWLDPMNASNWESFPDPVFQGNSEESVYSTRFPRLTSSPDGTETWMLYTASSNSSNVWASSRIRIAKIDWNEADGLPKFPLARGDSYQHQLPSGEPSKFLNPILDEVSAEPNAFVVGDSYYMALTNSTSITILKSAKLFDFRNAERAVVYTAPEGFQLKPPSRLQQINGESYLYFSMQASNDVQRIYVSKAENRSDLMHNWESATKLLDGLSEDHSFHGTVFQHFGQSYLVWAQMNAENKTFINIALMENPTKVVGPVVLLKEPLESWECHYLCATEYPSFLYNNNVAFMIFGASENTDPDSSLSYMSIEAGRDPLDVTNWYTAIGPVFTRNDEQGVYAPGRASFVSASDGQETWMIYHGSDNEVGGNPNLNIRIERITWDDETGYPIFPEAHGLSNPQPIPGSFGN